MTIRLVIERPFQRKGSFYRSSIVTRAMWGWFAIAIVHVNEHEYATTAYNWQGRLLVVPVEETMTDEGMTNEPMDAIELQHSLNDIAISLRTLYVSLIQQGFPEAEAMQLTRTWLHGISGGKTA
jgi:hypothetical protein